MSFEARLNVWPHRDCVSTIIRHNNALRFCRWKRDMMSFSQNIYFESRTSSHSTSKTIFIWMYYVVGLLAYNPKFGLPVHQTSLCILFLWPRKVFFFQRKVERNVEILRMEAATRLLTQFSVNVKDNVTSCNTKISSNTIWWCHAKPNVKAAD